MQNLEDPQENPMVRHECAEALGSIAKVGAHILRRACVGLASCLRRACVLLAPCLRRACVVQAQSPAPFLMPRSKEFLQKMSPYG